MENKLVESLVNLIVTDGFTIYSMLKDILLMIWDLIVFVFLMFLKIGMMLTFKLLEICLDLYMFWFKYRFQISDASVLEPNRARRSVFTRLSHTISSATSSMAVHSTTTPLNTPRSRTATPRKSAKVSMSDIYSRKLNSRPLYPSEAECQDSENTIDDIPEDHVSSSHKSTLSTISDSNRSASTYRQAFRDMILTRMSTAYSLPEANGKFLEVNIGHSAEEYSERSTEFSARPSDIFSPAKSSNSHYSSGTSSTTFHVSSSASRCRENGEDDGDISEDSVDEY